MAKNGLFAALKNEKLLPAQKLLGVISQLSKTVGNVPNPTAVLIATLVDGTHMPAIHQPADAFSS